MEAFSVRGLGRLAESWNQNPPFAGDNAFGNAIADYRQNIIQNYSALAEQQGLTRNPAAWFAGHRQEDRNTWVEPVCAGAVGQDSERV